MKKIILIGMIMLTANVFAANREQAKQITDQLNTFVTPGQSTTPNKGLLYRSNRDNVDDTQVVTNLAITVSPTQVIFTRGENLALTRCTADYGTAVVNPTQIIVATTRVPIRVSCSTNDGALRAFYTTYQQ